MLFANFTYVPYFKSYSALKFTIRRWSYFTMAIEPRPYITNFMGNDNVSMISLVKYHQHIQVKSLLGRFILSLTEQDGIGGKNVN